MRSYAFGLVLALGACGHNSGPGAPDLAVIDLAASDLAVAADLSSADLTGTSSSFGMNGPETFTMTTVTASLAGDEYSITVYMPATAGARPVVAISPGFGQPGSGYAVYAERLASFGIVALLRDDPGFFTGSDTAAEKLEAEVATWLPAQNGSGAFAGRFDLAKVGLMGHSRGGQVSLLAATGPLLGKVVAFFGLDPVDGMPAVKGNVGALAIPSVFMGETLDGTSPFGMACAPAADNYDVLYTAAPSPSLELTAVGAAHFDFEQSDKAVGSTFCQMGTAGAQAVLDMAVTLSTGFFARELLGSNVGANLDGAGAAGYIGSGLLTRTQK